MLELGAKKHDLVAVCAAMASGTGLAEFAKRYPERFFDVALLNNMLSPWQLPWQPPASARW